MNIQTNRLLIKEIENEDWKNLKNIATDFKNSQYAIYDLPLPVEDEEIKTLTKQFADSHLFFAVFLRDTSTMIGYVCFHKDNENYDLGYCFHSDYHGCGYAFESCRAAMDYIKHTRNVKTFTAGTALKNIPSCKLLKKLGFVLSETEILSFNKDENGNDISFEGGNFAVTDLT